MFNFEEKQDIVIFIMFMEFYL